MDEHGNKEWQAVLSRKRQTREQRLAWRLEELNSQGMLGLNTLPGDLYVVAMRSLDELVDHWLRICSQSWERTPPENPLLIAGENKTAFTSFMNDEGNMIDGEIEQLVGRPGVGGKDNLEKFRTTFTAHCAVQQASVESQIELIRSKRERGLQKEVGDHRHKKLTLLISAAGVLAALFGSVISFYLSKIKITSLTKDLKEVQNITERHLGQFDVVRQEVREIREALFSQKRTSSKSNRKGT